ncbi:MAG: hypothetical protein L0H96_22870 [Humibacillus sp.]|nr:hypothetical protein [Humibacillus sp.]MDN5779734.1 hypothetical protein [Humibacillus sp.]
MDVDLPAGHDLSYAVVPKAMAAPLAFKGLPATSAAAPAAQEAVTLSSAAAEPCSARPGG